MIESGKVERVCLKMNLIAEIPHAGIVLICFAIGLVLLKEFFQLSSLRRLPPGPRPWPVVGNLLLLKGNQLSVISKTLAATYGPVITIWIGSKPLIMVTSPDLVHSVFHKQGAKVSGRATFVSSLILLNDNRGLTGTGHRWKFLRRLVASEVMGNARLAAFRPIRNRQIDTLVDNLRQKVSENQAIVVSVKYELRFAVFNILLDIIFKRTVDRQTFEKVDSALEETFKRVGGQPRDHIPLLKWIPDRKNTEVQKQLIKRTHELLYPFVDERRKIASTAMGTECLTCYVDHLLAAQSQFLTESKAGQEVHEFSDTDIVSHALELLNAGIDTTAIALEYALANLIIHPEMQEKLFNEIDGLVGRDRDMNEDDILNLPYLKAVVHECLRRHPPGHIMPIRTVTSPGCCVAGYNIPVGTLITGHLESISSNPNIWPNASQFDPERFLGSGHNVDLTGSSRITMIPFGIGRRICPAINVAQLHIQLILGRLIQSFEWKNATAGELPDLECITRFASPLKHPLQAVLRVRKNC